MEAMERSGIGRWRRRVDRRVRDELMHVPEWWGRFFTDQIEVYEVDREKQGPKVEAYDIELIPTIVIEDDGEEVARFVEGEDLPAAIVLAEQLE